MRFKTFSSVVLFIVLQSFSTYSVNAQNKRFNCWTTSGKPGICKAIRDCNLQSVYGDVSLCSTDDASIVVCCPNQQQQLVSISSRKCKEYEKKKCNYVQPIVIGGQIVTNIQELPFMALLGYNTQSKIKWECGGALISEQFILTAAHCLTGSNRAPVSIAHLGFLNQNNKHFNSLQEFKIIQTFRHPNRTLRYRYHDIALLKLDRPVSFTDAVYPACLHEEKEIKTTKVQAAGWGQTEMSSISEDLRKVNLDLISHSNCTPHYMYEKKKLPHGILDEFQFCAGNKGKDTCQGDSGGPAFLFPRYCLHSIVGITSIGISCGSSPGIYTRVSGYIPWIESIVWPEK